jgi:translation initiation factor 2B subunit (eIF-2B alpha/beta/delta family)
VVVGDLDPALDRRIALLASDRESGASEVLDEVIAMLREALDRGDPIRPVARAICRAQPSMASVWNAALEALASERAPGRFEWFAQRVARSGDALVRFADVLFAVEGASGPLRLVTLSFSRSVVRVIEALARHRVVRVACSESRPALEGRRLASRLSAAGIAITCFSDAALGHALAAADAVLFGADAVAPEWFLNKSGTRMLAATAARQGLPVYVLATRDKFVTHAVGGRLVLREGAPADIWEAPPPGVTVRNPYFETTPLDLVTSVISDVGILGTAMVPDACNGGSDPLLLQALEQLG